MQACRYRFHVLRRLEVHTWEKRKDKDKGSFFSSAFTLSSTIWVLVTVTRRKSELWAVIHHGKPNDLQTYCCKYINYPNLPIKAIKKERTQLRQTHHKCHKNQTCLSWKVKTPWCLWQLPKLIKLKTVI